jgi:hypothetical protein
MTSDTLSAPNPQPETATSEALLRLEDELRDDTLLAHASYAAVMGLREDEFRDDDERGVIHLINMLARRLGDRCRHLAEIRAAGAVR